MDRPGMIAVILFFVTTIFWVGFNYKRVSNLEQTVPEILREVNDLSGRLASEEERTKSLEESRRNAP